MSDLYAGWPQEPGTVIEIDGIWLTKIEPHENLSDRAAAPWETMPARSEEARAHWKDELRRELQCVYSDDVVRGWAHSASMFRVISRPLQEPLVQIYSPDALLAEIARLKERLKRDLRQDEVLPAPLLLTGQMVNLLREARIAELNRLRHSREAWISKTDEDAQRRDQAINKLKKLKVPAHQIETVVFAPEGDTA